jgi:hypothetical protein
VAVVRAVYRGYHAGSGKRAGQVTRLHIIREQGPRGWEPGKQTLCGQAAWPATNSPAVVISPLPARPPEGLTWCSKCIGRQAELLGLLDEIAASIVAYDPELTCAR